MNLFRWILVGVGILILMSLFIYAHWSVSEHRRERKKERKLPANDRDTITSSTIEFDDSSVNVYGRPEPSIGADVIDFPSNPCPSFLAANEPPADEKPSSVEPHVIVLHVVAQEGESFAGRDILAAMSKHNLRYGKMKIFHRVLKIDGKTESLFGIANMVEPGVFEATAWDRLKTPGLALFLQIPAPIAGVDAFDNMIETALQLQDSLDGVLLDDQRDPLTHAWIDKIRLQLVSSTA